MPSNIQDTQPLGDSVTAKNFEWDNEGILHEIGVNGGVEDVDRSVVTGGSEQWQSRVESNASQSTGVISDMSLSFTE